MSTATHDHTGHDHPSGDADLRFAVNPYRDWVDKEGIPLAEGFAVNLMETPVGRWERYGANGSVVNVAGRGDFLDLWLIEVPPASETTPVHHLFETVVYVISGHGSTLIDAGGRKHSFEWGPHSMFAIPLNASYQFFNGTGNEPARLAMTTQFPLVMNVFRNDRFIFETDFEFTERYGTDESFQGKGRMVHDTTSDLYKDFWETNFVPDLSAFNELTPLEWRGKASNSIMFLLADGALHAHCSEIPVGRYKLAHRHIGGTHIYPVNGPGYSLLWYEGDEERIRVDWDHGWCYSPPDNMYHQHFNLSDIPSRYFAVKLGSRRYPFTQRMRTQFEETPTSLKNSKYQINADQEDPAIKQTYLEELAKRGMTMTG
jgi:mannose-6-phosphate isomerase-like protein (cupin superfamily)